MTLRSFTIKSIKKDYELPLDIPLTLKRRFYPSLLLMQLEIYVSDLTTHRSMLINVSRFICIQNDLKI